jgi:type IV pilus assembly protein PilM
VNVLLNQKLLSFDFGSRNIHIAEGINRGSFVEITRLIDEPVSPNVVVDGRIEDINLLQSILRETIKRNSISTRQAVITIQGSSVVIREALLPLLSGQQLDQAVRYEMEQYLPVEAGYYVIEYRVLGQVIDSGAKKYRLRMAALPKEIADACYSLLGELRLKPAALDIHPNAVSKLFFKGTVINRAYTIDDKPMALIDMGYRTISVNIFRQGIMEYNRLLTLGSRDIDSALAAYLKTDAEQAEKIKVSELNLSEQNGTGDPTVFQAVRPVLSQWIAEIQKVLQYYNNKNPNNRVDTLYLFGGGSALKGLDQYMEREMNLKKAERINSLSSVKSVHDTDRHDISGFINVIGAIRRL